MKKGRNRDAAYTEAMSQRYAALLNEWRNAAAAARDAQQRLGERFDRYMAGQGPEPTPDDVKAVARLREIENRKLQAALDYAQRTASGPPTRWGDADD